MFPHVSVDGLAAAGFRVCIFPNQAIRASVRAMQEVLATLRKTGRMMSVDSRIATLDEMAVVAGVSEAEDAERRYTPVPSEALLQESSL
jgi:2-methylisocitrate lyase-like PEP mutase family enzyme